MSPCARGVSAGIPARTRQRHLDVEVEAFLEVALVLHLDGERQEGFLALGDVFTLLGDDLQRVERFLSVRYQGTHARGQTWLVSVPPNTLVNMCSSGVPLMCGSSWSTRLYRRR